MPARSLLLLCAAALLAGGASQAARAEEPRVELVLGRWLAAEQVEGPAPANASPLNAPFGVDFAPDGTMVVVELGGGRVHTLDKAGHFRTIAGDGSRSYTGDGGPALGATFNGMHNIATPPDGSYLIADTWNHVVRKIDPASGLISTLAGTGQPGFSGDGGPASEATFHDIMCITLNPAGDALYLADLKNLRIRRIDLKTGIVTTVAGNGQKGVPGDGALAVESPLVDPRAAAVDSKGNLYILERGGHALRVVDPTGKIRTVAGTGKAGYRDGAGDQAQLNSPKHLGVDRLGRIFIADDGNAAIRLFDPATGALSTVLGRGRGEPVVTLKNPHGVCVEGNDLYVVDMGNDRILRLIFEAATCR